MRLNEPQLPASLSPVRAGGVLARKLAVCGDGCGYCPPFMHLLATERLHEQVASLWGFLCTCVSVAGLFVRLFFYHHPQRRLCAVLRVNVKM